MHAQVRGTLPERGGPFPAGTPYARRRPGAAAVDPRLPRRLGRPRLRPLRRVDWTATSATRCGRTTGSSAASSAWRRATCPRPRRTSTPTSTACSPRATSWSRRGRASSAAQIVLRPPVPVHLRPLVELSNFVDGRAAARDGASPVRLLWDPARALARRGGAEYLKRVVVPLLPRACATSPSARRAAAA